MHCIIDTESLLIEVQVTGMAIVISDPRRWEEAKSIAASRVASDSYVLLECKLNTRKIS